MSELIERTYKIVDKGIDGYTEVITIIDEELITIKQQDDNIVMTFDMAKELLKLLTELL